MILHHVGPATICALLTVLWSGGLCLAESPPPQFQGSWEVIQVAVDLADQPHWRYEPNDPRLLGRIMTIGSNGKIEFNLGPEACDPVDWSAERKTRLDSLVGKTFPRPPRPGLAKAPTIEDFGLKVPNRTVTPYRPLCSSPAPSSKRRQAWGDAWFVAVPPERILVEYDGDTILLLRRTRGVEPSFSCTGKLSPTETAICNSIELAGYDRSVAAAYTRSLKRRESEKEHLLREQQHWLQERNQCVSDPVCLENRMRERVDILMQD